MKKRLALLIVGIMMAAVSLGAMGHGLFVGADIELSVGETVDLYAGYEFYGSAFSVSVWTDDISEWTGDYRIGLGINSWASDMVFWHGVGGVKVDIDADAAEYDGLYLQIGPWISFDELVRAGIFAELDDDGFHICAGIEFYPFMFFDSFQE